MKNHNNSICEQLESRRLLSATLVDGVLKIVGTDGEDYISVGVSPEDPGHIRLWFNVHSLDAYVRFRVSGIQRIEMYGLAGNDGLGVMGEFDPPVALFIKGGRGDDGIGGTSHNDTLYGGDGADTILGSPGNDSTFGQAGDDHLMGGEGDDLMIGGDGVDRLEDSGGNDTLKGGAGSDHLTGGEGNDRLFGGDGDDLLADPAGHNLFDGGVGKDNYICDRSENIIRH